MNEDTNTVPTSSDNGETVPQPTAVPVEEVAEVPAETVEETVTNEEEVAG